MNRWAAKEVNSQVTKIRLATKQCPGGKKDMTQEIYTLQVVIFM